MQNLFLCFWQQEGIFTMKNFFASFVSTVISLPALTLSMLALFLFALTGCSGGGDDTPPPPRPHRALN